MHTPSIAFRHLCRKPVLGACEPCSDRDEQVGQALFVQGTQHCALLTTISGLCSVWVSVTHSPSPSTKATQRGGGGGGGVFLSHPCLKEADTTVLSGTRKNEKHLTFVLYPGWMKTDTILWDSVTSRLPSLSQFFCPQSSLPPSPPPPRLSLSLSLSLSETWTDLFALLILK